MIRKLQIKLVAACMVLVTAVLAVVFLSSYLSAKQSIEALSHQVLQRVIRESKPGGALVRPDIGLNSDGGKIVQLPYFTVEIWDSGGGTYNAYVTGGTYANLQDREELTAILTDCMSQEPAEGSISRYGLRYLRWDKGITHRAAFVDMSMEQATLRKLIGSYLQIGAAALLLLLGVSILLSRWATRPVEQAWRQQRQFLSDASHELKTPLTVILSNAELLSASKLEERPARWTGNIQSEARRMKSLVEEMLTLARADNAVHTAIMTEISLSDLSEDCALSFEPVAFEANKPLKYEITPDIKVLGDSEKLRQLISVLLDNAIKYGRDGGVIQLILQKTDRQMARLIVSNPGDPIPPEQISRLFERFYRADASRGEQSGFGLGLPIAATIASEHKGTLKAESDVQSTRFLFHMPCI